MRIGTTRFLASTLAVAMGLLTTSAALAQAGGKSFPDEWYFLNNGQRYDSLKALEGKPAAALSIDKWIGAETTIAGSKGKVIVVDFWATWCGPCVASIPHNVEMVKKYGGQGLVFIGVHDSNSGWDKADNMVKSKGINYPVGLDKSGGASTKAYGLQFWPTYIAIDRSGTVRAAGLTPDKVEDVVKVLLAEQAPGGGSAGAKAASAGSGEFGPEVYLGGATRPLGLREIEGKRAPDLHAESWIGNAPAGGGKLASGSITVLTFVSPSLSVSMKEFEKLAPVEKEFATQGVAFMGVCDNRIGDAWTKMQAYAKAKKLTLPIMQDTVETRPAAKGSTSGPARVNATSAAYGVEYFPATIIIDRSGKVRAAGVRADKVKAVIEKLLGEAAGGGGMGGGDEPATSDKAN